MSVLSVKTFFKNREWSPKIALDFGTASVLAYADGRVLFNEPAVVAVDKNTDKVVKVGREAMDMLGRTPENIEAQRPMKNGIISEYEVTLSMFRYFIRRAMDKSWLPPTVLITVPTGITEVEIRAVVDAAREAGASRTYIVEEVKAAAVGAGLDITASAGCMVVNIGGSVSDVAVLSMGGIVVSDSVRVGGEMFDRAIANYVREKYGIIIGERTSEDIKLRIGCVYTQPKARYVKVCGRSMDKGLPQEVILSSREMIEAMMDPMTAILDSVTSVIEATPPELVGDILRGGLVMTGGGSMLQGFDQLITHVTGIRARVAKKPVSSAVLGAGRILKVIDNQPEGRVTVPVGKLPE